MDIMDITDSHFCLGLVMKKNIAGQEEDYVWSLAFQIARYMMQ